MVEQDVSSSPILRYQLSPEQALAQLAADSTGLSSAEEQRRRMRYGSNELAPSLARPPGASCSRNSETS